MLSYNVASTHELRNDREMLSMYGCDTEIRKIYPQDLEHRKILYQIYSVNQFLQTTSSIYARPASRTTSISQNCQMYLKLGCAFVTKIDFSKRAASGWLKYLSDNENTIKSSYLQPIKKTVEFILEYTGIYEIQVYLIF